MPEFQLKMPQICPNFPAALRAAGTKTPRFPLKETVFAVKNTQIFAALRADSGGGVLIRTKHLVQMLVGGVLFVPKISGKLTGGVLRRGGFNSNSTVHKINLKFQVIDEAHAANKVLRKAEPENTVERAPIEKVAAPNITSSEFKNKINKEYL